MVRVNFEVKPEYAVIFFLVVLSGLAISQPSVFGHQASEVSGLDSAVRSVLSSENVMTMDVVPVHTSDTSFLIPGETSNTTLSDFTDNYGRVYSNMELRGCYSAVHWFCVSRGYETGYAQNPSCGWPVHSDQPCPSTPGCTIPVNCIERA